MLEANPWREDSKPVYILTHRENQLCTMKTRRNRRSDLVPCAIFLLNNCYCFPGSFFAFSDSEVERELGLLFSKGRKRRPEIGEQAKQSGGGTKFQMLVEDIREGVLVSLLLDEKTFF